MIDRLKSFGLQFSGHESVVTISDQLKVCNVVVSGVFKQLSRDDLKSLIEQHGGKVVSSISNKTTFIVAGDNMGPSKLEKSQKLGIPIKSEDEFLSGIKGLS